MSNSIFLVTTTQYCAYFTNGLYGVIIRATKEKCKLSKKLLEVTIMNKTAERTVTLDKGCVDVYTENGITLYASGFCER